MHNKIRLVAITVATLIVTVSFNVDLMAVEQESAESSLYIATDFPYQSNDYYEWASVEMNNAVGLILESRRSLAGRYTVKLRSYDNSTSQKGFEDPVTCANNAKNHQTAQDEVAVIGPLSTYCTQIMLPVMGRDLAGPITMISPGIFNFYPGLTREWGPDEPTKYYPFGKRNFFRLTSKLDSSMRALAEYIKNQKLRKIYVLNDGTNGGDNPYNDSRNILLAKSFIDSALTNDLEILNLSYSGESWDTTSASYESLFRKIKQANPDAIVMIGYLDYNGIQLVKDKVKILGDNRRVKLFASEGFFGYPDLTRLSDSRGIELVSPGKWFNHLNLNSGFKETITQEFNNLEIRKFQNLFQNKYGTLPRSNLTYYAAAATQIILEAISKSDGTRAGVLNQMRNVSISKNRSLINSTISFDEFGDITQQDITLFVVRDDSYIFRNSLLGK